jgi:hypothetical protein
MEKNFLEIEPYGNTGISVLKISDDVIGKLTTECQ